MLREYIQKGHEYERISRFVLWPKAFSEFVYATDHIFPFIPEDQGAYIEVRAFPAITEKRLEDLEKKLMEALRTFETKQKTMALREELSDKMREMETKAYSLLRQADLYEKQGKQHEADELYAQAIEAMPSLMFVGLLSSKVYKRGKGTVADAVELLKKGLEEPEK